MHAYNSDDSGDDDESLLLLHAQHLHTGSRIEDPDDPSNQEYLEAAATSSRKVPHYPGPMKNSQVAQRPELSRLRNSNFFYRKPGGTFCRLEEMQGWMQTKKLQGKEIYATVKADGHFVMYDGNNCFLTKNGNPDKYFVRRHLEKLLAEQKIDPPDPDHSNPKAQGTNQYTFDKQMQLGGTKFSICEKQPNVNREYYKSVAGYMKRLSSLIQTAYIREVKIQILYKCGISSNAQDYLEKWKKIDAAKKYLSGDERQGINFMIEELQKIKEVVEFKNGADYGESLICAESNICNSYWEELHFAKTDDEYTLNDDYLPRRPDHHITLLCELVACERDKLKHHTMDSIEAGDMDAKKKWAQCLYKYKTPTERYEAWCKLKSSKEFTTKNRFFARRSVGRTSQEQYAEPDPFPDYTAKPRNSNPSLYWSNVIDDHCIAFQVFDMYPTFQCADNFMLPFIERMKIVHNCILELNQMIDKIMQVEAPPCAWYRLAIVNVVPVLPIKVNKYQDFLDLARVAFDTNQEGLILCAANKQACPNKERESKRKFKYMFDFQVSIVEPTLPELTDAQKKQKEKQGTIESRAAYTLFEKTSTVGNCITYGGQLKADPEKRKIKRGQKTYETDVWNYYGSWGANTKKLETPGRKLSLDNRQIACLYPTVITQMTELYKILKQNDPNVKGIDKVWVRATSWDSCNLHRDIPLPILIRDLWLLSQRYSNGKWIRTRNAADKGKVIENWACNHDDIWETTKKMTNISQEVPEKGNLNIKSKLKNHMDEYIKKDKSHTETLEHSENSEDHDNKNEQSEHSEDHDDKSEKRKTKIGIKATHTETMIPKVDVKETLTNLRTKLKGYELEVIRLYLNRNANESIDAISKQCTVTTFKRLWWIICAEHFYKQTTRTMESYDKNFNSVQDWLQTIANVDILRHLVVWYLENPSVTLEIIKQEHEKQSKTEKDDKKHDPEMSKTEEDDKKPDPDDMQIEAADNTKKGKMSQTEEDDKKPDPDDMQNELSHPHPPKRKRKGGVWDQFKAFGRQILKIDEFSVAHRDVFFHIPPHKYTPEQAMEMEEIFHRTWYNTHGEIKDQVRAASNAVASLRAIFDEKIQAAKQGAAARGQIDTSQDAVELSNLLAEKLSLHNRYILHL